MVLETALSQQLRALADSLLAYLLLKKRKVAEIEWWYQFVTQMEPSVLHLSNIYNQEFNDFRKDFLARMATRQIKPLATSDLKDVELRIYGGYISLCDDISINKQLAYLGSSCRVAVLGSQQIIINRLKSLLEESNDKSSVDGRFIFGHIGSVHAYPTGHLLNFVKELAVSPYLSMNAAAFNYEDKIVMRDGIIQFSIWLKPSHKGMTLEELNRKFGEEWKGILIHETAHRIDVSIGESIGLDTSYSKYRRREDTINDICRFSQHPRSLDEIRQAMVWNLENPLLSGGGGGLYDKDLAGRGYDLESLLKEMQESELIQITDEGKFYSPIYEDGQRWII
jgi:hypothetical protein